MSLHATFSIDTRFEVGPIDRRIFGGFLEHLGRAIYGGICDPESTLADHRGFRRDVLHALSALKMPVVRYPGGNFVSAYNWKDGVGPLESRPRRPDIAWASTETNRFGTDEFVEWCRAAGASPMLAVNLGTGAPAEAAELVEYCNLASGTHWSDQRRKNGSDTPHNVKLWCLGNEMDGTWQAGHVPAETYAQRAVQASMLMKGIDPTIETILCGSSGNGMPTYLSWDRTVLEHCWDQVDYVSAHRYSQNHQDDSSWYLAEGVEIDRVLADYAGLLAYVRGVKKSAREIFLAFDEWNVWYRTTSEKHPGRWAVAPPLLEEWYNLEDAIVAAQYLAAFIRRADLVKIACLAQIVNVLAPMMTRRNEILLQTIYYPFLLFSRFARGIALTPSIQSDTYHAGARGSVPVLDAAATFDASTDSLSLFLINRHPKLELSVEVHCGNCQSKTIREAQLLTGELKAGNTWEHPQRIRPRELSVSQKDSTLSVKLPAPAFAVIHLAK